MKNFVVATLVMISSQIYRGDWKMIFVTDGVHTKYLYNWLGNFNPEHPRLTKIGDTVHFADSIWVQMPDTLDIINGKFVQPAPPYIDDEYDFDEYPPNFIAYNAYYTSY